MIIWEVFDHDEKYNAHRRYYTVLEDAVKYLLEVSRVDTLEPWGEPCVRAWAADYEGEQYVAFFTNGGLIQSVLDSPHVGNTVLYMGDTVEQAIARRHIVFNEEKKNDGN